MFNLKTLTVVPILLPTVLSLDVHGLSQYDLMIWFSILVAVNLQTAWLSPPLALSAYFLQGRPKLGPEGYIFGNDAVHGNSVDWTDTHFYFSSNCPLAA